jgi:high affinity Mn2+ porin
MVYEAYYRIQISKNLQLTPDYQHIVNPASNHARGPVEIYGTRLRFYF